MKRIKQLELEKLLLIALIFRAFAVGSEDATTRVFITPKSGKLSVNSLGGHKDEIIGKENSQLPVFVCSNKYHVQTQPYRDFYGRSAGRLCDVD